MDDQMTATRLPPILDNKHHDEPAVFKPENLMREARRQRRLPHLSVPEICILDPDGDIVRALRADGGGESFPGWACYHTEMQVFELGGERVGIVGCAVGASFAVLVAEQMFASGCRLLLSITSAGRIAAELPEQSFFVVIEKALLPRHSGFDGLKSGGLRRGSRSRSTRTAMHRGRPGCREINPAFSSVSSIW